MAIPIVEQIAQKILAALQSMDWEGVGIGVVGVTFGVGAGAFTSPTSGAVRPEQIATFQPKDYRIVITQGDMERIDAMSCPGNPPSQAWMVVFNIACIIRQSVDDVTPIDTLKNHFTSEVIQALTTDPWPTWDGLAYNSYVRTIEQYQASDGSNAGHMLKLEVHYRTDENNPFSVRA